MVKLLENFITEKEEIEILSHVHHTQVASGAGRNMITRFGSKLPYNSRIQSLTVPKHFQFLLQRLVDHGITPILPDHITVNEYHIGQSIDWHTDSKGSGPIIMVLSMMSPAIMGLKKENEVIEYNLTPRSLVVMDGDHRWDWKHCIYPVKEKRFSMVFRKGTQ